jgi:hypothetical protein
MNACNVMIQAAPATAAAAPVPSNRSGRARTGKIARLPQAVREETNERLREGAPLGEILSWLNSLPEVRAVLRQRFDGEPISEQNLSRWRCGGYAGWLENQQVREAFGGQIN